MDRLPIRVRLTAAFALAMLLVLVAAASFVYVRQRSALTETIDHGLERRSDDVAAVIRGSEAGLAYAGRGRLTDPEDTFIQVLTQDQLLEAAWDLGFAHRSNVVEVYVRYLREKIDRPFGIVSIETVRGAGYRLRKGAAP